MSVASAPRCPWRPEAPLRCTLRRPLPSTPRAGTPGTGVQPGVVSVAHLAVGGKTARSQDNAPFRPDEDYLVFPAALSAMANTAWMTRRHRRFHAFHQSFRSCMLFYDLPGCQKIFRTVLTFPSRFLEFVTIINIEERYRAHTDDETMLHGGVRAATTMHEFLQGTTGNKRQETLGSSSDRERRIDDSLRRGGA